MSIEDQIKEVGSMFILGLFVTLALLYCGKDRDSTNPAPVPTQSITPAVTYEPAHTPRPTRTPKGDKQ